MQSPRRRAILRDMGLDHWVLRGRLPAADQAPTASASAAAPQPGTDRPATRNVPASAQASLDQLQAELEGTGGTNRRPAAAARNPSARQGAPANRQPAAVALGSMPAALQCTWLGAHAYLGRQHTQTPVRRFLRDLMVAAADTPGTPSQLPFDAADLAQRVGLEQARLGLQAFVVKRLVTVGAQALLLDEALSADLPGLEGDCYRVSAAVLVPVVPVPDLTTLLDDGAAKRALWRQLLALRQR
ncbi:MAG: hypothetical protein AB8B93_18655 [Pseudomonadales bacterium]